MHIDLKMRTQTTSVHPQRMRGTCFGQSECIPVDSAHLLWIEHACLGDSMSMVDRQLTFCLTGDRCGWCVSIVTVGAYVMPWSLGPSYQVRLTGV